MFVRRIATVTISAPEASIAARVAAKSLYLPVPTSSRERYARPDMSSRSSCARTRFSFGAFMDGSLSSATDRADDFDAVAIGQLRVAVPASGYYLAIAFDRDALALEGKLTHQVGNRCLVGTATTGAVKHDREHGGYRLGLPFNFTTARRHVRAKGA